MTSTTLTAAQPAALTYDRARLSATDRHRRPRLLRSVIGSPTAAMVYSVLAAPARVTQQREESL